jgi:hypothetical protein
MNAGQKALRACAEYARLSTENKRLTKAIGDALDGCPGVNGKRDSSVLEDGRTVYGGDHDDMHLKSAYTPDTMDDGFGGAEVSWLSDKEIREEIACCPACLAAHEAIQARKAARKSLGAVKRHITMLGRAKNERDAA